mgnify:CR=1 FL=1
MKKLFSALDKSDFESTVDSKKTSLYTLKNKNGTEVSITNFGGRIVELFARDGRGEFADVVLGHKTLGEYVDFKAARFFGAAVGRFANRIANGEFKLNGKTYQLEKNNGPNALHGGSRGFDMRVWDVLDADEGKIDMRLVSPDGDAGYPAALAVDMRYELGDDDALKISYRAASDADTIVNLTNHSFFNLRGEGIGDTSDHILQIFADRYTPVNENLVPTGELADVSGTPFDFRNPARIGGRIGEENEQLKRGCGYDHNWVLNAGASGKAELAAVLYDPQSGRELQVFTDQPGLQFFAGGTFASRENGKNGLPYARFAGIALETQNFPDAPNKPNFPSPVLRAGGEYRHVCVYKFGTRK